MEDYLKLLIKGKKNISDSNFVHVRETMKTIIVEVVPALAQDVEGFPNKPVASKQLFKMSLIVIAKIAAFQPFLNELTEIRDIVMI